MLKDVDRRRRHAVPAVLASRGRDDRRASCRIGPYARLRPGAALADDVHVGNFVEVKASTIGAARKANHLAYIGDATVGAGVNFGAGSITANYDGANKHRTVIGDDVHIGSNCVLVAPIDDRRAARRSAAAAPSPTTRRPGADGRPCATVDRRRLETPAQETEDRRKADTMCGIVGASSTRNVVPILIDGIRRLEYRGYDSTGLAVIGARRVARARSGW